MVEQIKVAIIGAGVSGLYAAWQCVSQGICNPHECMIFEASDRLGGRIETVSVSGFNFEAGCMRLAPHLQPLLKQLVNDLDLQWVDTTENYGVQRVPDAFHHYGLRENENNKTPLELIYLGISSILNIKSTDIDTLNERHFTEINTHFSYQGKYLWQWGWWNLLRTVLSEGAIRFIMRYGRFYHLLYENLNAAAEIIFFIKVKQSNHRLKTIKGGMQQLIDALTLKVRQLGIPIQIQQPLLDFEQHGDQVLLHFPDKKYQFCEKLLLTMPSAVLAEFRYRLPNNIRQCLDAVVPIKLAKYFFIVKKRWWTTAGLNDVLHAVPTRELHHYDSGDDERGMLLLYTDAPYINYWRGLYPNLHQQDTRVNKDDGLIDAILNYLPIKRNQITDFGVRDWGLPPYNGALSIWGREQDIITISQTMQSFHLGSTNLGDNEVAHNVFLCGDSYSDYQGFIEGALRVTQKNLAYLLSENHTP